MAGNLVSIMAVSTHGRGGYVPEIRSDYRFTLTGRNAKYICASCGTVIQDADGECPYCYKHGKLSHLPRRTKYNLPSLKERTVLFIAAEHRVTRLQIKELLSVPMHVVARVISMLNDEHRQCIMHGNCR